MIRILKLIAIAGALALPAAALADGHFDRTLSVSGQPDLYVSTGSGNITLHAGVDRQIHINAHIGSNWNLWGRDQDSAAAIRSIEQNPPIVQEGNTVRISPPSGPSAHVSIDYDITVPPNTALNLHSGSGDLRVAQVGRYLAASTGSGNLEIRGLHGAAELSTGSGDITAELEGAGDVKARSGSGNIHLHNVNGALNARAGSGDVDAEGRLTGQSMVSTGSGNVKLRLGADAHFNLEGATGSGNIHVRYPGAPVQDDHSRHHLTGPVNGGGPPLEVRTGSGDIEIGS